MIEKISLCAVNESGETVELAESCLKLQAEIDVCIADTFTKIIHWQQSIADDEIRRAEKFYLAQNLQKYLKEMKENYAGNTTTN